MRWSERQRAMLQAMGLRVWAPADAATEEPDADTLVVEREGEDVAFRGSSQPVQQPAREPAERESATVREMPAVAYDARPAHQGASSHAAEPVGRVRSPAPSPSSPSGRPAGVVAPQPDGSSLCSQMGWDALRAAVAHCEACGLSQGRTHTVFGVGHEQAHWMIVGEAPGEQEDKQGEPFVGPAGHLLDAMLSAVGHTRGAAAPEKQVFIANTLKCRPPRNRNPLPEELTQCAAYLHRQIELVQPRVLVAMGRFAIQQLLNTDAPIGRLRGQVHDYRGIPVIVTYHPAYLLRQLTEKAKAWEDLCLAEAVYRERMAAAAQPV